MGSYDGAETCELVVCYLLYQLEQEVGQNTSLGLYRDDGLAIVHGTPRETENIKKAICRIFQRNGLRITIEANKKIVDFLDTTLNLTTGSYGPYIKPGNTPLYINAKSNHPPSVIKAVPNGINKRLSTISSNEQVFNAATPVYQDALKKSGFNYTLKYKKDDNGDNKNKQENKNKQRKRNITWYNPPFSQQVQTNIGRIFLKTVDSSFPKGHILQKIFNRSTLKVSYSCLPNVQNQIDANNKIQIAKATTPENKPDCNCREKANCPLDGKCRVSGVVYQATVTSKDHEDNKNTETYVGLTDTPFKQRLANHKQSFEKERLKKSTELSKHIWSLKDNNKEYTISWKILGRARSYSNTTKRCNLCLLEKFYIICHRDKSSLNKRSELVNQCRHAKKFLLCNT